MTAVNWARFEADAGPLAGAGKRLLVGEDGIAIAMIATVARDGHPRMAAVCPIFAGDGLYLSAGAKTPKRFDLHNDGRFVLHAFLGENDEEFQISGSAIAVTRAGEIAEVHAATRFTFQADDPVFHLLLERCLWGYWEKVGQPGTFAVRKRWSCGDQSTNV